MGNRIQKALCVSALVAYAFTCATPQARADVGVTLDGSTTGFHPVLQTSPGFGVVLDGSATGFHPILDVTLPAPSSVALQPAPSAAVGLSDQTSDGGTVGSTSSTAAWVGVVLTVAAVVAFGVIVSQMQSSYNQGVQQQQAAFNAQSQQMQAQFQAASGLR